MGRLSGKKFHVDLLFALALFCVFALTAIVLVIAGGTVYKNTVVNMNKNYDARTALAYITQKMHRSDENNAFEFKQTAAGDTLVIKQLVEGKTYNTYIYESEGYLCELVTKQTTEFDPSGGDKLLEVKDFSIEEVQKGLYKFIMGLEEMGQVEFFVSAESE